jgi:hypothetical protein
MKTNMSNISVKPKLQENVFCVFFGFGEFFCDVRYYLQAKYAYSKVWVAIERIKQPVLGKSE